MSETDPNYISRKAFAELQGWSPSYITKLGDQGKLVLTPDGRLVDVAATLARLNESADPTKQHVTARHEAARLHRDVGQHVATDAPDDVPADDSAEKAGFWVHKTKREAALAVRAELELAKELKQLVAASDVHRALADASRMMRDMMLAVPSRVAGQVITAANAGEAERIIRAELRAAMEQFSRLAREGLTRVGCPEHVESV